MGLIPAMHSNGPLPPSPNVLCIIIYIYLQSCTTMVSHLLPLMADITHSHCFEYISMAIACIDIYYICLGPIFWCEVNCDIYLVIEPTCFGNLEDLKNMYMHSALFFNANSTIMSVWWLHWPVLVTLVIY